MERDRPCGSFGEAGHSFALSWQAKVADDPGSSLKNVHLLWLLPLLLCVWSEVPRRSLPKAILSNRQD